MNTIFHRTIRDHITISRRQIFQATLFAVLLMIALLPTNNFAQAIGALMQTIVLFADRTKAQS